MMRSFLTAFLGTAVEFFETVAIGYAILRAGFPREAVSAIVLGQILVFIAGIFLWPLHQYIPIFWFRMTAASLLTWMGLYWSIKSVRRLYNGKRPGWVTDPLGKVGVLPDSTGAVFSIFVFLVMLKSSAVEAFEILLIIFPVGAASHDWVSIISGAMLAIILVSAGVWLLHGHLKKVPEVILKLATGILLFAIGVSWLLELIP